MPVFLSKHHLQYPNHQSSSKMAEGSSASSTQEGSYIVFFIVAPQAGQLGLGFWQEAPHAEQMYSSARNRCVRRIQWAGFIRLLLFICANNMQFLSSRIILRNFYCPKQVFICPEIVFCKAFISLFMKRPQHDDVFIILPW